MTDEELMALVTSLETRVWEAVVQKDGITLITLFVDQYVEITLEGKRCDRNEIVASSPEVDEIREYTIDSEKVIRVDQNCAILSYHLTLDGRTSGERIIPRDRWATSVWTCASGNWRRCFFQQSVYRIKEGENPWLLIPAHEYDNHLAHPSVRQREFLDRVFAEVLNSCQPHSIALLGCATGGGLDHVDPCKVDRITAIDINSDYLEVTRSRFSRMLSQLELQQADLERCELEGGAYELIHCALVLEYVDTEIVIPKMARWLSRSGVLVMVLQLASPEIQAVIDTGCESLKRLEPIMRLHEPEDIRQVAASVGLCETDSAIERLETGKQFYVGRFQHREL